MPSIRITRFAGLLPQVNPKALANDHAQVAHNCLLYDGWLRPMPKWTQVETLPQTPASLFKDPTQTNGYDSDYYLANAVRNISEPFNSDRTIGINIRSIGGKYLGTYNFSAGPVNLGVPAPAISSHSFVITNNNYSVYPISRTYAITFVSGNQEGPPTVFEQIGTNGTLFEGDSVSLNIVLDVGQTIQYGITGVHLYRTIPGFDTSEQLGNPLETGFHFVGSSSFSDTTGPPGGAVSFTDISDSSQIPADLLISDQWSPPLTGTMAAPLFFGQSEGGWGIVTRTNGTVGNAPSALQFSERFMLHAWPMQNTVNIPELVTGMAIYYDDIFVGTQNISYHTRIEAGEGEVLNINVRPFVNTYACVPGTMVGTNFGAMYAAKDGLIALMADRDTVTSRSVASPGDALLIPLRGQATFLVNIHLYDAYQAAWWNGNYFGFLTHASQGFSYVFNQPSPSNNEFPLGQLVTIDTPTGTAISSVATGSGLFAAWDNTIYKFPLPGYGYESAEKATYNWLSKRYVMPGMTNFAAMKVVNDNSSGGTLNIYLYGYNVGGSNNPDFVYSRPLTHSKPFRIPHQHHCVEWEIQVLGTAIVQEIHLATSIKDLIEEPGNG